MRVDEVVARVEMTQIDKLKDESWDLFRNNLGRYVLEWAWVAFLVLDLEEFPIVLFATVQRTLHWGIDETLRD
jgi:hypothetical protein